MVPKWAKIDDKSDRLQPRKGTVFLSQYDY